MATSLSLSQRDALELVEKGVNSIYALHRRTWESLIRRGLLERKGLCLCLTDTGRALVKRAKPHA